MYLCHLVGQQPDKSGRTALHWTAISGHKEAAELLVESGAFKHGQGRL